MSSPGEIVLVTGISGFLGQHLLKLLLKDDAVLKIRGLDKSPLFENLIEGVIDPASNFDKLEFYQRDLLDVESCRKVLKNVNVALHCAALVSYEFPPNKKDLYRNNVLATKNLLGLCIEEGIGRFVHCSSTEIAERPYFKHGITGVIVYWEESKISIPEDGRSLIFGEYAASKLEADKLVLECNGTALKNGRGALNTVSLRPTLLYGEGDKNLISILLKRAKKRGNVLGKPVGKQQMAYVGNAAWAMICAKNTLRENSNAISGLPVNVTDDTIVENVHGYCEKFTRTNPDHRMEFCSWSLPLILTYFLAYIFESVTKMWTFKKLPVSFSRLHAYSGSLILYNRSRASINMNYSPLYSANDSLTASSRYYNELLNKMK